MLVHMRKHVKKDLQTSEPVSEPVIFKLRLEAVSAPTASKLLADQLRNKILKGELLSGTTLPSERELVDQTGVSRGAVRQALALLQSDGLVETRPGRFGGSIIRRPSEDSLAEFLALFIEGRSIPLASLLQFREIIGAPMAALAASNRTARDLAEIKSRVRMCSYSSRRTSSGR
jgi:GntR family transcriptional repressor for pyruvate dehydrogenase complex